MRRGFPRGGGIGYMCFYMNVFKVPIALGGGKVHVRACRGNINSPDKRLTATGDGCVWRRMYGGP